VVKIKRPGSPASTRAKPAQHRFIVMLGRARPETTGYANDGLYKRHDAQTV
jgi:hypothetical protein